MISDGLGSTAQAGSDRSDGTLASGDVPGEDRRLRWPGAEGRVGKDLMSTRLASSGTAARSAGAIPCRVDLSDQERDDIERGAHPFAVVGSGRGYVIDWLAGKTFKGCAADIPQRWVGRLWWFVASFSRPEPFPFYVARIDDRLLLRPTPEGVSLEPKFLKNSISVLFLSAENRILQKFPPS